MGCAVGLRCGSDLVLLWLQHRPVATALIQPLAWELPYTAGSALKCKKKKGQVAQVWIQPEAGKFKKTENSPLKGKKKKKKKTLSKLRINSFCFSHLVGLHLFAQAIAGFLNFIPHLDGNILKFFCHRE